MKDSACAGYPGTARSSRFSAQLFLGLFQFLGGLPLEMGAQESPPQRRERNVDGIMDNSFLVEEAYNQEPGVIQHILTGFYGLNTRAGSDERGMSLTLTQEWPVFSQTHQFSYTVPYNFTRSGGQSRDGLGDVLLNYRYQAYFNERTLRAFAPRLTLVLPTGDKKLGFSDDTVGYQMNLPFSTALGDRWFLHLNGGLTYLPDVSSSPRRDLLHYNAGASVIYAATRDTHVLLEWIGNWNELADPVLPSERQFAAAISPGIRHAFNFVGPSQLVLGLAAPIGLTAPAPDYGVFLYLSFEHRIKK